MRSHQHNKYMGATYFTPAETQSPLYTGLLGYPACTPRDVEVQPCKEEGSFICEMLLCAWTFIKVQSKLLFST